MYPCNLSTTLLPLNIVRVSIDSCKITGLKNFNLILKPRGADTFHRQLKIKSSFHEISVVFFKSSKKKLTEFLVKTQNYQNLETQYRLKYWYVDGEYHDHLVKQELLIFHKCKSFLEI